jgi:hypothetical protein
VGEHEEIKPSGRELGGWGWKTKRRVGEMGVHPHASCKQMFLDALAGVGVVREGAYYGGYASVFWGPLHTCIRIYAMLYVHFRLGLDFLRLLSWSGDGGEGGKEEGTWRLSERYAYVLNLALDRYRESNQ